MTLYSIKTGLATKNYQINENGEEIMIMHKFEFNNVTNKDIEMINLSSYNIK